MGREANTPLLLWVCAAVCAHYMFAQGGDEVARIHEDSSFIAKLSTEVRSKVKASEQVFDMAGSDILTQNEAEPAPPPPPPPPVQKPKATPEKNERPKPEAKAEEKIKLKVTEEKPDPVKKLLEPPPQTDHRVAVKQHTKPNQEDNPNAAFIGDEANRVDEETVATQTSHDEDDPNPTPGGNHSGPQDKVGDSDRTKIADSEQHAGEKNRAPGERGTEFQVQRDPMPTKPMGPVAIQAPPSAAPPRSGGDGRAPSASNQPPQPVAAGGATGQSPEVTQSPSGSWSFNPLRPDAGALPQMAQGHAEGAGQSARPTPSPRGNTQWLGLGGQPGPGQVNLNLSTQGVVAVVGQDQLRKERVADGERRKSEHRGSWTASSLERWRSAIENYVSSVKPGNQTALNSARVPFASYLVSIHNRIHPIFADNFLDSLDGLPGGHPLNSPKLHTRLEIVLSREGRLVRMGVVRTSGITAFDIAALDSVQRASPFGPAPTAIISTDGNVYLHWEFHRDHVLACSTQNARPFMLNVPPKAPTPEEPAPAPKHPGDEQRVPPVNLGETRQGAREVRRTSTAG